MHDFWSFLLRINCVYVFGVIMICKNLNSRNVSQICWIFDASYFQCVASLKTTPCLTLSFSRDYSLKSFNFKYFFGLFFPLLSSVNHANKVITDSLFVFEYQIGINLIYLKPGIQNLYSKLFYSVAQLTG